MFKLSLISFLLNKMNV